MFWHILKIVAELIMWGSAALFVLWVVAVVVISIAKAPTVKPKYHNYRVGGHLK